MKALKITNFTKNYDNFSAVKNITFNIEEGEVFALLGRNGAGKSTTISCIMGLEKISSGKIEIFNQDVEQQMQKVKLLTGLVPQEVINHGFFNVEEILQFQSGYYGINDNKDQIEFLLKNLFLWDVKHKLVSTLSGGMKRRVLIAKALLHKPKLLLLDEPTAGVDIELRQILWEFIKTLQNQGISILLTTHYLEEAEKLCKRTGILNQGEIVCIGQTQDLITQYSSKKIVLHLSQDINIKCNKYNLQKNGLILECNIPNNLMISELLSELNINPAYINDINISKGTLEEVFMNQVSKK